MLNCVFCEQENLVTSRQCQGCGAPLPPDEQSRLEDAVFHSQLQRMLEQGEKLKAITAYQRRTGASLSVATEFFDSLDRDQQFATTSRSIADVEWAASKLLERGEKIDAIKLYRDQAGLGLQEAKAEVDALEIRLGLEPEGTPQKSGCFGIILLCGVGSLWLTQYC
jgi:ribosomal protein L7/L12